jgi:hypothetical protein
MTTPAPTRHRTPRLRSRLIGPAVLAVTLAGLLTAGVTTQAATRARAATSNSICNRVSAASVSAIVGFKVPAASQSTFTQKATPANHETSSVDTSCTYGSLTAGLKKTVLLEFSVASASFTEAEIVASIKKVDVESKTQYTIASYSGLGVPAYFLTQKQSGVDSEILSGLSGKDNFGAVVYSDTFPASKLAELAKLAEKL